MFVLKLYIAGRMAKSRETIDKLKILLESEFKGQYSLDIIDVLENPQLAEEARILATPTLAKDSPPPPRKVVGDISNGGKLGALLGFYNSNAG